MPQRAEQRAAAQAEGGIGMGRGSCGMGVFLARSGSHSRGAEVLVRPMRIVWLSAGFRAAWCSRSCNATHPRRKRSSRLLQLQLRVVVARSQWHRDYGQGSIQSDRPDIGRQSPLAAADKNEVGTEGSLPRIGHRRPCATGRSRSGGPCSARSSPAGRDTHDSLSPLVVGERISITVTSSRFMTSRISTPTWGTGTRISVAIRRGGTIVAVPPRPPSIDPGLCTPTSG